MKKGLWSDSYLRILRTLIAWSVVFRASSYAYSPRPGTTATGMGVW